MRIAYQKGKEICRKFKTPDFNFKDSSSIVIISSGSLKVIHNINSFLRNKMVTYIRIIVGIQKDFFHICLKI